MPSAALGQVSDSHDELVGAVLLSQDAYPCVLTGRIRGRAASRSFISIAWRLGCVRHSERGVEKTGPGPTQSALGLVSGFAARGPSLIVRARRPPGQAAHSGHECMGANARPMQREPGDLVYRAIGRATARVRRDASGDQRRLALAGTRRRSLGGAICWCADGRAAVLRKGRAGVRVDT